ncbi:MAG: hypothetical protein EOO01_30260 [Chitinophagaceae bacterium]|nr:MAG: hypothetical protein EOO01_30260 [Chitinophagaceae bacterium]
MSLSKTSGGTITLSEAQDLVKNFRSLFPDEIKASFIGSDNLQLIIDQEDCIGIRAYNGYDVDTRELKLVLVGVDSKGLDMTKGYIMDKMVPCPTTCDSSSALYF